MDLFDDICPLFNIGIATISLAQLRFVAWQDIFKAAAAATKNDQKEEEDNKTGRIRAVLSSFQQGTADASAEQGLLLELKEYFTSIINSNNNNNNTATTTEVFGCRAEDLEMAVTTLLLPKTLTQLLDCFTWYRRKSKEFRRFLHRTGGVDFYASLLDVNNNNIPAAAPCAAAAEDTAAAVPSQKDRPFASLRRRSTKITATTTIEPMLVAWNNYRVDTGPSGKELFYMIFLDKCQERIIVTFRGSITLSDWSHDIRVNMHSMSNPFFSSSEAPTSSSHQAAASQNKEMQGGGGGGSSNSSSLLQERQRETLRIHAGFYQYLCKAGTNSKGDESKFDQILHKLHDLLKQYPTYKVIVTGHSLGGAASTLFAFMAVAAAATSATRVDNDDNVDNSGAKKDLSERFRMWLPTPNKVARLFGGTTAAPAAAAAEPEEPPSVTQEINRDDEDDNQVKEVEHSGIDTEASFFQIGLPTPITVVSFGSPTVGDGAFCRAFGLLEERGVLRHFRVSNEDDIVPSIPVSSIPTTLERVYLYRHTGIHLLILSQTTPVKQFYRWCSRKMNKKNQSDPGGALFRICHGDRKKMKNLDRNNNNSNNKNASDYNIAKDVTVVAHDFADAVAGLNLRTPIPHLPPCYNKRLHRIEVYLRRLSLDQLYQEYLLDFNNIINNNNDDDDDKNTGM